MAWFRWRHEVSVVTPATAAGETLPDLAMGSRLERALVALAVHAQQLDTRLERIERRLDGEADALIDLPTQADVIEVQVHSARVAAEVARVAVELRGQIDQLAAEVRKDPAREAQRLQLLTNPAPPAPTGALHGHVAGVSRDLPPAASA